MLADTIKQQILKRIKDKNLTIGSLERKANLPTNTIRNITSGTSKNPGINSLVAIAEILDCRINDLIGKPIEKNTAENFEQITGHNDLLLELFKEVVDFIEAYIQKNKITISFEDFLFCVKESYIVALNKNSKKLNVGLAEWLIEKRKNPN